MRWAAPAALALAIGLAAGPAVAADLHVISQIQGDHLSIRGFQVVREAYRRIGLEAVADIRPNERAIISADTGDTDGDTMRMAGLEPRYPHLVRVPEPVLTFDSVAFTAGMSFPVAGWESLRPYSICVVRGFKLGEAATQGMTRELVSTNGAALRMVKAGHCQVAVLGEAVWLLVDELKLGPVRALNPPVSASPLTTTSTPATPIWSPNWPKPWRPCAGTGASTASWPPTGRPSRRPASAIRSRTDAQSELSIRI